MTNTTNVVITTSATTIATLASDYTKAVARMNEVSLIKFCHSKEFRDTYGTFTRAKNKKDFIATAIERLEALIEAGDVSMELRAIPGMNRSIAIVEKAIAEMYSGLKKLEQTPEQKARLKRISYIEKCVYMSKITARMMEMFLGTDTIEQAIISQPQMKGIWGAVDKFAQEVINLPQVEKTAMGVIMDEMGVRADFTVAYKTFLAFRPAGEQPFVVANGIETHGYFDGVYITQAYNGLNVYVTPAKLPDMKKFYLDRSMASQEMVKFTLDTISPETLKAVSQVLFVDKQGNIHRFNANSYGDYGLDLKAVCSGFHVNLLEVLGLLSTFNVEFSSLMADSRNFCVIQYKETPKKNPYTGGVTMDRRYVIADNAFEVRAIRNINAEGKFWGISNPDTLHKGLLRAIWATPGFAELSEDGVYKSMAGLANKTVARAIKLVKQGEEITFGKVMIVINTNGNKRIGRALSTGVVYTGKEIWDKHGQCRITSSADQGGIKGTLAPLETLDPTLAEEGVTLMSFGSVKAKMYAIQQLTGVDYENESELPVEKVVFKRAGKVAVDVLIVDTAKVVITNNYTIQAYQPDNRDALLRDWDMANDVIAERAAAKISVIQEDNVFVEYMCKVRDEEFNGSLSDTIEALLIRGDIKPKSQTVSITSSEYDMMIMCFGKAKAIEWMNNLLLNKHNLTDVEKDLEFKRMFELTLGKFPVATKDISASEFYGEYVKACVANDMDPNIVPGTFIKRDFLVDLFTGLFDDEGFFEWMRVTDKAGNVCMIPMGKFLRGSFAETSKVFDINVAVTGFVGKLLKYVAYGAGASASGRYKDTMFKNFCRNVKNELLASITGKGLGKLTATGQYCVLSVAFWSDKVADVVCTTAKSFNKSQDALIAKHPLLFDMALAGVTVKSAFPSELLSGLDKETIKKMNLIFGNTMFVSEEMLLSLQNDCDGDLARLTWHDGMSFEKFTPKTLSEDAVGKAWFDAYVADERAFDNVGEVHWTNHSVEDIAVAMGGAKYAKDCVAIFTNNAQMFAQRCEVDLGIAKDDIRYNTIHKVLNIWVQEFSMNAIKHKAGSDSDLLPEYYLVSKLKFLKMEGTEINPGQFQLLAWLEEKGIDMADHGFKNNLDFARVLHYSMCNLEKRSLGATLIGKDLRLSDIVPEDHITISGFISQHFHKEIMQDRLVLAYAKKLGFE